MRSRAAAHLGRSGAVRSTSADDELIRRAARRVGLQIAVASTFAVVVGAFLAFCLIHRHGDAPTGPPGPPHVEPAGDQDALIRNALIIGGGLGIVIAGLTGFVIARRAVRPLGQALALQRRFVADAGHELRTPLTVLHTRAQLLARRIPTDDPARQIADQLLDDSRLLSEIVDELLISAAMSANPGLGEELDPAQLLHDVADRMQLLAEQSTVLLRTKAEPGLLVRGSRPALRRALIALVDNAISHSKPGGTVCLAAAFTGQSVMFTITDEGEGIPADSGELLWTRFSRGAVESSVPPDSRPIGNRRYGLGLALVREIAMAHGGTVSLDNTRPVTDEDAGDRPQTGAVATMTLPLAGRTAATAPPRETESQHS